jgi:hypothetical protein
MGEATYCIILRRRQPGHIGRSMGGVRWYVYPTDVMTDLRAPLGWDKIYNTSPSIIWLYVQPLGEVRTVYSTDTFVVLTWVRLFC